MLSFVCLRADTHYRDEMNRPPSSYADITQEGFTDITVMSHATATANAFFVTVLGQSIPAVSFGLSLFWLLGQFSKRSAPASAERAGRPTRKFKLWLRYPE
jgi:hypothetical protein